MYRLLHIACTICYVFLVMELGNGCTVTRELGADAARSASSALGAGRWAKRRTLLRPVVATWPGRLLVLAAVGAVLSALAVASDPADRPGVFAQVSQPTQMWLSIFVPFVGVLLVHAARRSGRQHDVRRAVLSALALAVAVAVFGAVVSLAATATAGRQPGVETWGRVPQVLLGCLLVQLVAQLTGTAAGLLVRRSVLACLLTIVLPLGLWLLLSASTAAQDWLTPYASARQLLSGQMTSLHWAQWLTMMALWCLLPNLLGLRRNALPRST